MSGNFVLNHNLTTKRCKKELALMLDTENGSISWLQHRSVIANKLGVKKVTMPLKRYGFVIKRFMY